MIRVLTIIVVLGLVVLGLGWVADQQGDIIVNFRDREYSSSPIVALSAVLALAVILAVVMAAIFYVLRLPKRLRRSAHARRQQKGLAALSTGLIAAGAGDIKGAQRASANAAKHLGSKPLTLLLEAQTAILSGDRRATESTFARMAENPETRVLGLRGLHAEAQKRGDADAAHSYAEAAHKIAPLPWAGQAVLEHHVSRQDWQRSLDAIDTNLAQKIIDKTTAKRQRAVLQTAIAQDVAVEDPDQALRLAGQAVALAPDLVPATRLLGELMGRRGDIRKASRALEAAWKIMPHPDLADVYLDLRSGDSSEDRLNRARALARLAPDDAESKLTVARAAIGAREFGAAREAMSPLIAAAQDSRPSNRVCLLMADLEEAENGPSGMVREWLARASRAPRDKAWVADGVISDSWAPFSPISGQLDAWRWQTPPERLSHSWDPSSVVEEPQATLGKPDEIDREAQMEAPAAPQIAPPREPVKNFALGGAPDDPGPQRA